MLIEHVITGVQPNTTFAQIVEIASHLGLLHERAIN